MRLGDGVTERVKVPGDKATQLAVIIDEQNTQAIGFLGCVGVHGAGELQGSSARAVPFGPEEASEKRATICRAFERLRIKKVALWIFSPIRKRGFRSSH
jgi:hypothetical protein